MVAVPNPCLSFQESLLRFVQISSDFSDLLLSAFSYQSWIVCSVCLTPSHLIAPHLGPVLLRLALVEASVPCSEGRCLENCFEP